MVFIKKHLEHIFVKVHVHDIVTVVTFVGIVHSIVACFISETVAGIIWKPLVLFDTCKHTFVHFDMY